VIHLRSVDLAVWLLYHDNHYVVIVVDFRARHMKLFDSIKGYCTEWRKHAFDAVRNWIVELASVHCVTEYVDAVWSSEVHDDGACMPRQRGEFPDTHGCDCALMALAVCAFILCGERWVGSSMGLLVTQASMPSFRRQAVHLLQNAGGQRFGNVPRRPPCVRTHPHVAGRLVARAPAPSWAVSTEWALFLLRRWASGRADVRVRHHAERISN
jgi:hypothetical protein